MPVASQHVPLLRGNPGERIDACSVTLLAVTRYIITSDKGAKLQHQQHCSSCDGLLQQLMFVRCLKHTVLGLYHIKVEYDL